MSLIDRVMMLCERKDITVYRLEKDLQMARNTVKKWDKVTPTSKALLLVADYFNVSTDFLLGRTQYESSHKGPITPKEAEVLRIIEEAEMTEAEMEVLTKIISAIVSGYKDLKTG